MAERVLTKAKFKFRRHRALAAAGLDDNEVHDIAAGGDDFARFLDAYETVLEQYGDALREIDRLKRENERLKNERKDRPHD